MSPENRLNTSPIQISNNNAAANPSNANTQPFWYHFDSPDIGTTKKATQILHRFKLISKLNLKHSYTILQIENRLLVRSTSQLRTIIRLLTCSRSATGDSDDDDDDDDDYRHYFHGDIRCSIKRCA